MVGYKEDVHFCRIGDTILTIKELHKGEICTTSETQNLWIADFAFRMLCILLLYTIHIFCVSSVLRIHLNTIRTRCPWTGGGMSSKRTQLDIARGGWGWSKSQFWADVFDEWPLIMNISTWTYHQEHMNVNVYLWTYGHECINNICHYISYQHMNNVQLSNTSFDCHTVLQLNY